MARTTVTHAEKKKTSEVMVALRDVHKAFGTRQVLRGLDLTVERGESVVIVGGSGTGKSVTLKQIIGLLTPDRGEIIVMGENIVGMRSRELNRVRRNFGMSFQEGALFDSMNVFENVAFPLRRHTTMSKQQIRERVMQCLDQVQLDGVEMKNPSELSGGMRRRVGFARAISLEPKILLFDEPTTGLDPVISDIIANLIRKMDIDLNATTITITHDMKVAFKIADRVAMLHEGKIVEQGTPEHFRRSTNPLVAQFIEGRADGPLTD